MTLANKAKLLWQSYGKTSEIGKKSLLFSYFRVPGKFGVSQSYEKTSAVQKKNVFFFALPSAW